MSGVARDQRARGRRCWSIEVLLAEYKARLGAHESSLRRAQVDLAVREGLFAVHKANLAVLGLLLRANSPPFAAA
jgi:hypothetical protein